MSPSCSPRKIEPSSRPIVSVAVRYSFAWRTMRLRIWFFAHPVSTAAMPIATSTRTKAMRPTITFASRVEIRRIRRCRATCQEAYQCACPLVRVAFGGDASGSALAGAAVGADQREQPVEIQRFFEESRRVEVRRAVLIERREDDHRDRRERRIGLLLAAEFPSVHHRHHQIEQNDVGLRRVVEILQRFAAVGHRRGLKSLEREQLRHHLAQVFVVFHNQHRTVLHWSRHHVSSTEPPPYYRSSSPAII